MISSVQVSINDIMDTVRNLVGNGMDDDMIVSMIRQTFGFGYAGMTRRAIARARSEKKKG
jgi:hypothetical protein